VDSGELALHSVYFGIAALRAEAFAALRI